MDALDVSKDWHDKQRQELLDKIQRLESEVEFLRKQQTQHVAQIEVKEPKKWPWLKVKNRIKQVKEITKEKFNTYILQKDK